MKFFLTLKHWQLFILLFGLPVLLQIAFGTWLFSSTDPMAAFRYFPFFMFVYLVPFLSWFYSMGVHLSQKAAPAAPMKLGRFKLFLAIPAVYMVFLVLLIYWSTAHLSTGVQPPVALFLLIIPMHLFSLFCLIYCIYFNAKALKTAELQRPVTFNDFVGEFFLIWFFFVGVWLLQPRINKLFAEGAANGTRVL